ncbi:23S rRNA (uracil(1939)-C(5))-methyltransferase RlmD [Acetobacterium woodii]|uniref:tRNA (Uracil-5-)-methyltransferase n=1 Tax=Acetobacterium woodii (strain ATCC 29683 / DSM 1030 / JCM 2381 / KCTC 1655 / WB1) TaxID=931626 RepID=H6LJA2_ACEWD|nr:23S rRNA (uracil(1939)-C(5))-methyltransferase RlmD [Acetobacterium woodii]AFA48665.1 tRNA (uracil-5-)-methyltransferase [Acetobacterium woodii DSM 1030]
MNENTNQIKIGEKYTIDLIDITHSGEGVGRLNNMIVFVDGGIPGDVVEIEIINVKKTYAQGKLLSIIESSPERVNPDCPYFNECGGCQILHMSYQGQLRAKSKMVKDALERIGGFKEIPISPIIGMEEPLRYRNKAQFKLDKNGMGFYAKKSHHLVHIEDCLNQPDSAANVIKTVNNLVKELNLSIYDERTNKGYVRGVLQRTNLQGENMITLIINGKDLSQRQAIVEGILAGVPNVKSIYVNINREKGNVILGKKSLCVHGAARLVEKIGDLSFSISPNSFFQVNSKQTVKLYDKIKDLAALTGTETIFDLYCGTGTIGLYLANKAKKVVGIESVGDAVLDARENAGLNQIENATFYQGRVEEEMMRIIKEEALKPDLIILDPPRKGCEESLLSTINNMQTPRIIYVSCNPATLSRDMKIMTESGYTINEIQPIDLFPGTGHVETVVLMSREK